MNNNCIKCNSTKIMIGIKVEDLGDGNSEQALRVRIDRNPNAMIFKDKERGKITANICAQCGYTEFNCDNIEKLWSAYCASKSKSDSQ